MTILEPGTKHRPIGLKNWYFLRPIGLCLVPANNNRKNDIWTSKYSFHRLMYKTKVVGNEKITCLHPKFLKIGQVLTILEPGTKHRPIGLKKHQFLRPIGLCFVPATNAWKYVILTSKYSFHSQMY